MWQLKIVAITADGEEETVFSEPLDRAGAVRLQRKLFERDGIDSHIVEFFE